MALMVEDVNKIVDRYIKTKAAFVTPHKNILTTNLSNRESHETFARANSDRRFRHRLVR